MTVFLRWSRFMVLFLCVYIVSCAPPIRYTPTSVIPSNLPKDIKLNIHDLYSIDPGVRANAAQYLGSLGPQAILSVPYLIDVLPDHRNIWQDLVCDKGNWRPFAVDCVDSSVHYRNQIKSSVEAVVNTALQRITSQNFEAEPQRWRTWWRKTYPGLSEHANGESSRSTTGNIQANGSMQAVNDTEFERMN